MRHKVVRSAATDTFRCNTPIAEPVKNTPFVINGDLGKIEKVSLCSAAALLPNASHTLHWVVRSGVNSGPGLAAVISGRNECIPFAGKTNCLIIAGSIRSKPCDRRAPCAATDGFNFRRIHNTVSRSQIDISCPRYGIIHVTMADRDASMSFRWIADRDRLIVNVGVVNGVVTIDSY